MRFFRRQPPLLFWCLWLTFFFSCEKIQKHEVAAEHEQEQHQEQKGLYKVIAIKYGDTIELLKDGKPLRVRLQGVDTPEKKQDFGTRAQQFTAELVFGKYVKLIEHDVDRYGRTVGEIILGDGRNLGYELVKNGFAWHYTDYSKDPELARLEAEARADKRGLWDGPTPAVAPWEFRKAKKSNSATKKATSTAPKTASSSSASTISKSNKAFYCESKGVKTYHLRKDCRLLKNCKSDIATSTLAQVKEMDLNPCKVCAD